MAGSNEDGSSVGPRGVGFDVEEHELEDTGKDRKKSVTGSSSAAPSAGSYDELMSRIGNEGGGRQGQALVPDELKADVMKLNRRIKSMNKFLLDPKSKFMQYWDFFTLSALAFTLIVTPFEVALLPTKLDALFFINWLVNIVFITDMVVNFILPYKESAKKGGGTVKDHKKIAKRYLTSWFPIDIISILPFDSIEVVAEEMSGKSPFGDNAQTLKIIKMIRLLRLLKLARILRASRIFSRWENELGISYTKMELIKWVVLVFCVIHLLACFWCILASLMGSLRDAYAGELEQLVLDCQLGQAACRAPQYLNTCTGCVRESVEGGTEATQKICSMKGQCLTPCEFALIETIYADNGHVFNHAGETMAIDYFRKQETWMCRYTANVYGVAADGSSEDGNVASLYFSAFYVAMLQVGGGVGSIVPENLPEYIFVAFCLLMGSTFWAMIVGSICGIVATGDPHMNDFKQKMDELNYFMRDMNIEQTVRVRAREYFRQTRDLRKKLTYNELIERLSRTLRSEVVLQMSKKTLETVWYLRACEPGFLVELAVRQRPMGFAPREKIPSERLCIVSRGVAAKAGNILTYGDHWGEDMIVSSKALRDMRHASALTYVEVSTISREDLEEILKEFPVSEREIRQSAMKIAMQRAIVVISEFVRMQHAQKAGAGGQLDKLAGVFTGGSSVPMESEDKDGKDPNDPSVILSMITGGKLKDIDEDGQIIEDDEDSDALDAARRKSSANGLLASAEMGEVLSELKALRKEIAELRKQVGSRGASSV